MQNQRLSYVNAHHIELINKPLEFYQRLKDAAEATWLTLNSMVRGRHMGDVQWSDARYRSW